MFTWLNVSWVVKVMAVVNMVSIVDMVFIPANPTVTAPHLVVIMVTQVVMVMMLHHGTLRLSTLPLLHVNVDGHILVDMSVDQDVDIVDVDPHGMFVVTRDKVHGLMRGPAAVMRTLRGHQSSAPRIFLLPPCLLVGVLYVSAGVVDMTRVVMVMMVIVMRVFPVSVMSVVTMMMVMTVSPVMVTSLPADRVRGPLVQRNDLVLKPEMMVKNQNISSN